MSKKRKKTSQPTSTVAASEESVPQSGKPAGTKYVLVDFENVQPKNLELLKDYPFRVFVFIGSNQAKLPRHVVVPMQALGEKAQYVEIAGSGPNALDFHIAYYIGELAAQEPNAQFHIVSRDRGFDPLIQHLRNTRKIRIRRETDLAEIPELRIPDTTNLDEQIEAIVKNLRQRGHSRPRKVKTLQNTINTLFTKKLDQAELDSLTDALKKRKLIVVNQNNDVRYRLQR